MQNDELRKAQDELISARAHYFDFYDLAPVGFLTINEKSVILDANLTIITLLRSSRRSLIGQLFLGIEKI
jgi:PAS domain-containing protein